MNNKPERSIVEVADPSYQPSKAELEADLCVGAAFKQAVKALSKMVRIRRVDNPKGD